MKSVVVCGSKKYYKEIDAFCKKLEQSGVLVFEPSFNDPPYAEDTNLGSPFLTKKFFKGLTLEHFDWIRKSEVCFVFNKDDYVRVSVSMEMAYASALAKPIFALSDITGDACRDALIDKVVKTPAELVKLL